MKVLTRSMCDRCPTWDQEEGSVSLPKKGWGVLRLSIVGDRPEPVDSGFIVVTLCPTCVEIVRRIIAPILEVRTNGTDEPPK